MFEQYKSHDLACYAGYIKDDTELLECTSGGIATALARQMIQDGGYVAGVAYSDDFYRAEYLITRNESDLNKFKGSKYFHFDKKTIYKDIKVLLDSNERVLFFGLPCIVAALRSFLGRDYDNLIACELICHGPTSQKVHSEYIKHLEHKYNDKIADFSVRHKRDAWMPTYLYAKFQNGQIFEKEFYSTEYGYAFSVMAQPGCYHCHFKGNNRTGDLMIGDFWGATKIDVFWNEKGVSAILAHTVKGKEFLQSTESIQLFETTFERIVANNRMVIQSRTPSPEKSKFEQLFAQKGLFYAVQHSKSLKRRFKDFLKVLLPESIRSPLKKWYHKIKR